MRRLIFAAAMCAAVLLPTAAAGASAPSQAAAGFRASALNAPVRSHAAPAAFVPLVKSLATGTIDLNVYQFDGNPQAGAPVIWQGGAGENFAKGNGTTDVNGHVEFTSVPASEGWGEVYVELDDGFYDLWKVDWPDLGWTVGLQPGQLALKLTGNAWDDAWVYFWAQNGGGVEEHLAMTVIPRTGPTTSATPRTITTGTEELKAGAVYFWGDEGLELDVDGITVTPGASASPTPAPVAAEAKAQRVWMSGWGSGKPGSTTKVVFYNYPAGWTNRIEGQAVFPSTAKKTNIGGYKTTSKKTETKAVTIPASVLPGYTYEISVLHRREGLGPLRLWTAFQTCTLKPSKTSIRRGTAINLSGVVPIKGHRGSKKGTPKYVTIYKTTSATLAKRQPTTAGGGSKASGWAKVARVKTDGLGKYLKKSLKPTKTTWYCVWYPKDTQHWGAWTPIAKVTVKK